MLCGWCTFQWSPYPFNIFCESMPQTHFGHCLILPQMTFHDRSTIFHLPCHRLGEDRSLACIPLPVLYIGGTVLHHFSKDVLPHRNCSGGMYSLQQIVLPSLHITKVKIKTKLSKVSRGRNYLSLSISQIISNRSSQFSHSHVPCGNHSSTECNIWRTHQLSLLWNTVLGKYNKSSPPPHS